MDYAYAGKYFSEKVLPEMKGLTLNFVNLKNLARIGMIKTALNEHHIGIVAAMQRRKNLLYQFVSPKSE